MILWDLPAPFVYVSLFILGAVIGSFLNVCVYRFPQHETIRGAWRSLLYPPSSCPYCRQRIRPTDNVPIFGWLLIRGRCRYCRHRISFRYPFIELLNGLLFVLVYSAMVPVGFSASMTTSAVYTPINVWADTMALAPRSASFWLHLEYAYYMVLVEALLVASLIDIDLQIIPDSVTIPAMIVGVLGSLTGKFWLDPVWHQSPSMLNALWLAMGGELPAPIWWSMAVPAWTTAHPILHGLSVSLAGLVVGGGIVWFVRIVGEWVFRREAMGFGDVVLMAMIGSFLGWQPTIVVFFLAPLCAIVMVLCRWLYDAISMLLRRGGGLWHHREIPFGPYLSVAAVWVLICWQGMSARTSLFFSLGPLVPVLAVLMAAALVLILWLVQGMKWLLRIPLYESPWQDEWTSADQLSFYANKDMSAGSGPLRSPQWPGAAAGQGKHYERSWRKAGY